MGKKRDICSGLGGASTKVRAMGASVVEGVTVAVDVAVVVVEAIVVVVETAVVVVVDATVVVVVGVDETIDILVRSNLARKPSKFERPANEVVWLVPT
jgi:hypothetical protein